MNPETRSHLKNAVKFHYDLQNLRISIFHRAEEKGGDAPILQLDEDAKKFNDATSKGMSALERSALRECDRISEKSSIYEWLRNQRGIGPTGAAILLSEFDIHKAVRPSQFWSFAGLAVAEDGHSPHPVKGEKLPYNSWLRSKCLFVIGGAFLKANNEQYRAQYDGYKHRKATQFGPCMLCAGTGTATEPKKAGPKAKVSPDAGKPKTCWNCVGEGFTPERAPWGRGDAHRHQAAVRFMVKQFLADFWRAWRIAEGLPVVPTYHEAKHGHVHSA